MMPTVSGVATPSATVSGVATPSATVSGVSGWRYDISNAPHDEPIIAAGNEGVVTVSRWNDKRRAWSMFTADVPPLAWMPWPKHPNLGVTK